MQTLKHLHNESPNCIPLILQVSSQLPNIEDFNSCYALHHGQATATVAIQCIVTIAAFKAGSDEEVDWLDTP